MKRYLLLLFFFFLIQAVSATTLEFQGKPGEIINETIEIIPANIVSITPLSLFNFTIIQDDFENQSEEVDVTISIKIPNIFSGTYEVGKLIVLETDTSNTDYNLHLIVDETEKYNVTFEDIYNVNCNEFGFIYLNFTNKGNSIVEELIISSNSEVFNITQPIINDIHPNVNFRIPIKYIIPSNTIGEMPVILYVNSVEYAIIFNVSDSTLPSVRLSANFDHKHDEEFDVCFDITDNVEIDYAEVNWQNESHMLGSGSVCRRFSSSEIGDIDMVVFANDSSGNNRTLIQEFKIKKIQGCDVTNFIKFPQMAVDSTVSEIILELPEQFNLPISFKNLECDGKNNTDCIRVKLKTDKNEMNLRVGKNDTYVLDGDVILEIIGLKKGEYNGEIIVGFSDYFDVNEDDKIISFKGEVANYDICQKYNGQMWGLPINVSPHDTGIYGTSSCVLITEYPIDTKLSQLKLFITQEMESLKEKDCTDRLDDKDHFISELEMWRLGLALIIFILIGIFVYLIKFKEQFPISI